MRLVFLGMPGVGKGTQAKQLSHELHILQVSTGDMLRAAISKGEANGKEAKSCVESGRLVPDELVIRIVKARLLEEDMKNGFILDGFPRTDAQADALSQMGESGQLDRVLSFEMDEEMLVSRLSGRRTCSKCEEIYHQIHRAPKQEMICDLCGGALIQRKDDHSDTVLERLRVYKKETMPLIAYYESRGLLSHIDANGTFDAVSQRVMAVVGANLRK
ncbi:MAG: adenylate kinase [Nitrospirota bacterium]